MKYYLLDRVTHYEASREVRGIKCVTLTDEILHDHFPEHPIFPGALLTEAMAQLAGFLLETTYNTADTLELKRAVLAQIDKMKFRNMTIPGDRLELRAVLESKLDEAAQVTVEAAVEGETRANGRLTFAMLPIQTEKVTQQRLEIYRIWTRNLANCPVLR